MSLIEYDNVLCYMIQTLADKDNRERFKLFKEAGKKVTHT